MCAAPTFCFGWQLPMPWTQAVDCQCPNGRVCLGLAGATQLRSIASASRNAVSLPHLAANTSPRPINKSLCIQLRSRHCISRTQVRPEPQHLMILAGFYITSCALSGGDFSQKLCLCSCSPAHGLESLLAAVCGCYRQGVIFLAGQHHGPPS